VTGLSTGMSQPSAGVPVDQEQPGNVRNYREAPESIPAMLGELERQRAVLWAELLRPWPKDCSRSPAEAPLLTATEVATYLRVPTSYVYDLARRGKIPCLRVGSKYVRFKRADIIEWAAASNENIESRSYHWYSSENDGQKASAASREPKANSGGSGRSSGRRTQHRGEMGARRATSLPASGQATPNPDTRVSDSDA
jgi:excisionase family DNA binding protein